MWFNFVEIVTWSIKFGYLACIGPVIEIYIMQIKRVIATVTALAKHFVILIVS